jgi:hypothetical protein
VIREWKTISSPSPTVSTSPILYRVGEDEFWGRLDYRPEVTRAAAHQNYIKTRRSVSGEFNETHAPVTMASHRVCHLCYCHNTNTTACFYLFYGG